MRLAWLILILSWAIIVIDKMLEIKENTKITKKRYWYKIIYLDPTKNNL